MEANYFTISWWVLPYIDMNQPLVICVPRSLTPLPSPCPLFFYKGKLYTCMHAQLCPTLCDLLNWNPPGSSVCGIFQARILKWVAISSSRSSPPRDRTRICVSCVSCIGSWILYHWEACFLASLLDVAFSVWNALPFFSWQSLLVSSDLSCPVF